MRKKLPIGPRFWAKADQSGTCWLWAGARDKDGYGQFKVTAAEGLYRQEKAHRVAFVLTYGPIRDNDMVLHHCDNPPCVRPTHLFLGDAGINRRDAASKGRIPSPTHLHQLGEANPSSKLKEDQVREIRRLYRDEHLLQREIGERYGMDQAVISAIVRRKTWRHI